MSFHRIVVALICLSCLQSTGYAQSESAPPWANEPLSLDRCVELALQDVVSTQTLRARVQAAQALLVSARTIPNPTFSYLAQDIGLPALLHQELLSFPLLYAYTRSQEATVARAQVQQEQAAVEEDRRQLRLLIGRAYHDARLSERLSAIEEQAVRIAADLVEKTTRRVAHGDAGQNEVIRAQAEELDARRVAEQATRRRDIDRLALSILLGAPRPFLLSLRGDAVAESFSTPLVEKSADDAATFDALLSRAHTSRPDLMAARAQLSRNEQQQRLEQRRVIPLDGLQLTAGARQTAGGVGGVIALAMPLPLFDHNRGPRLRAAANLDAARAALISVERQVALEVATALREWRGAHAALTDLARPLSKLRTQALTATQRQFSEGVATLLDVVTAQRDAISAERALLQAERDADLAAWRLRLATDSR